MCIRDRIILDEPTNHLDMSSIAWLENYLLNYKGAVLIQYYQIGFAKQKLSQEMCIRDSPYPVIVFHNSAPSAYYSASL